MGDAHKDGNIGYYSLWLADYAVEKCYNFWHDLNDKSI
jgi:hypothetical protein